MRRQLGALLLTAALGTGPACAQYPAKPVRVVVALPAGSTVDVTARALAEPLSRALRQPVIVENKPGAEGAIAALAVRNAAADGHTLLLGQGTAMVGVPLTRKQPPYDPLADFTPISFIGRFAIFLFAHPDLPAKSMADVIAYARANPGKLSYSTNSITEAIVGAQIAHIAQVEMVRVPYKGGAAVIQDLLSGRLHLGFMSALMGLPHAEQGRLRVLATVLPNRSPAAPSVPTLAEAGFAEATMTPWIGMFGPARLAEAITVRLAREIGQVLQSPEVRAQLERHAIQAEGSTPDALASFLEQELATWARTIRSAGISLE